MIIALSLVASLAASASAETLTLGASDFRLPSRAELRAFAAAPETRAPAAVESPAHDDPAFFPLAGKTALLGYADTEASARAAAALWTERLAALGLKPQPMKYAHGLYTIYYESRDGLVVRRFFADPRQFAPKDDAALEADKALTLAAMKEAGLTVFHAPTVRFDGDLPSYQIYYLTTGAADEEKELQPRVLARGDDIDFDILENAGLTIVSKPKPWILVYIGPQVGFVGMVSKTLEGADEKLAKRLEYLRGQGFAIIGSRVSEEPGTDSEYRFYARAYFYF